MGNKHDSTDNNFQSVLSDSAKTLLLEFLTRISDRPRTYDETMEAWQSHCPRQTIWEDAIIAGLVEVQQVDDPRNPEVVLTPAGQAILNEGLLQTPQHNTAGRSSGASH